MNNHPTKYESYRTNDLKVVAITKYNKSNMYIEGTQRNLKMCPLWAVALYIQVKNRAGLTVYWKCMKMQRSHNSYKNCRIKMAGKYDQRPIILLKYESYQTNDLKRIASTKWCGTDEQEDKPKTICPHTIICWAWKPHFKQNCERFEILFS
jgi:hypothetical protein